MVSNLFLFTVATASAVSASASFPNHTIRIKSGLVQGFSYFNSSTSEKLYNQSDAGVTAFLGIPYAADTSGQNRWRAPQERAPWNNTFQATTFGISCPSSELSEYSEDCLSVNIWTPAKTSNESYPVFVWSYGSGMTSSDDLFDGGGLAHERVVVVTYNHRDGVYGWLAHEDLLQESAHNSTGNYGTMDWFYLLQWVQDNIAAFGGDPSQVTIAGQSFGSAQVYHAINSPLVKGKFHRAIAESGLRTPYDPFDIGLAESYVTMSHALEIGRNYTASHNVSTIEQLRNLTTDQLLVGSEDRDYTISNLTALWTINPLVFKPALDGYYIPSTYIDTLLNGPVNDVPIITGNTKDESGASTSENITAADYLKDESAWYGNLSSRYFALYPGHNSTEASRSWNAAARDTSLVSTWMYANDWIKNYESPIYTYYWDHAPPGQTQGAFHMSEIPYVFNALYVGEYPYEADDWAIAAKMTAYWVNFIRTGNSNDGGAYKGQGELAQWTENQDGVQSIMHLGDGWGEIDLATPERVALIEEFLLRQTPF
ncbi:hypothetical protein PRZ48_004200 [Zasmidium cellare]|uniref:Carboxylesterase type B domain-containing protein n=1 Tax=Zasmidium cellare TaxID=395010 RepID=A0ABR0EYU7_ZASCE|nr:hypothetical protein PRZ48_004200 [Zasmidium cellare]